MYTSSPPPPPNCQGHHAGTAQAPWDPRNPVLHVAKCNLDRSGPVPARATQRQLAIRVGASCLARHGRAGLGVTRRPSPTSSLSLLSSDGNHQSNGAPAWALRRAAEGARAPARARSRPRAPAPGRAVGSRPEATSEWSACCCRPQQCCAAPAPRSEPGSRRAQLRREGGGRRAAPVGLGAPPRVSRPSRPVAVGLGFSSSLYPKARGGGGGQPPRSAVREHI